MLPDGFDRYLKYPIKTVASGILFDFQYKPIWHKQQYSRHISISTALTILSTKEILTKLEVFTIAKVSG